MITDIKNFLVNFDLKKIFSDLFIPRDNPFSEHDLSKSLSSKFEFISTFKSTIENIKVTNQPLSISLLGTKIDFSWFDSYHDEFKGLMRGAMWLITFFAFIKKLSPNIDISD